MQASTTSFGMVYLCSCVEQQYGIDTRASSPSSGRAVNYIAGSPSSSRAGSVIPEGGEQQQNIKRMRIAY
jgi:hypothetical protein